MRSLCMGKYFYDTKGNIISQEKFIRQGYREPKATWNWWEQRIGLENGC